MNKTTQMLTLLGGLLVLHLLSLWLHHRQHLETLHHLSAERAAFMQALPGLMADAKAEIARREREAAEWLAREQLKPLR